MFAVNRRSFIFFLLLCCVLEIGCAASHAPHNWLPSSKGLAAEPYGGWIFVESGINGGRTFSGEFIGTTDSSVGILSPDGFKFIPFAEIQYVNLKIHLDDHSDIALWGLVGSLSTLTHGLGLVLTLPVWLITTIASTSAESHNGLFTQDFDSNGQQETSWWSKHQMYARFPGGIPKGLDCTKLKAKKAAPSYEDQ
jgi:hypothetical protein